MKFYKFNGAGNDFIIINNLQEHIAPEHFPLLARTLCERHLSIGADGLMLVAPSDRADFRMEFYNSDGTAGEMCGNGARCICRYGYEMGLSGETQTVETASGIVMKYLIISGCVTVTGAPLSIWRRNNGITEPFEPRTLPNLVVTNSVSVLCCALY